MKRLKYLLLVLTAVALCACSKDTTSVNTTARQTFVGMNAIGVYQNNKPLYTFDKKQQQVIITPSSQTIRLQDDAGDKYAELILSATPQLGEAVSGSFTNNFGKSDLPNMELENMIVLQSAGGYIWLWSEKGQLGFILPWEK